MIYTFRLFCLIFLAWLVTPYATTRGQQPAELLTKLEVTPDISISYPMAWSLARIQYRNARELVTPPEKQDEVVVYARMLITTETQSDHKSAVRRLGEIAAEFNVPTNFLGIGGWPALERSLIAPILHPGDSQQDNPGDKLVAPLITTAIAMGNLVFRLETAFAPETSNDLIEQAIAIGRSATFRASGNSSETEREIQQLYMRRSEEPTATQIRTGESEGRIPGYPQPSPNTEQTGGHEAPGTPVQITSDVGELEIAVSNDGKNIVIGTNNRGYSFSQDGGESFKFITNLPLGFPYGGDPSVAFGGRGRDTFYYSSITFPDGTPAAKNMTGCAVGISTSNNDGATFSLAGYAAFCPRTGPGTCRPDQPHIATDRFDATSLLATDQVYAVWAQIEPMGTTTGADCTIGFRPNIIRPFISCSTNGGATWQPPQLIGGSQVWRTFPRIATGGDGSVYVVIITGSNLYLFKYSSCSNGLNSQAFFPSPVLVATGLNGVDCPVPGLDRCNDGNTLSSPMIAVDTPQRVYVAYADRTKPGNEDIIVQQSNDGGLTWPTKSTANTGGVAARRFMPWICTLDGAAIVTWYDRSAAAPATPAAATNDLTNYMLARTFVGGIPGVFSTINLSVNPDPQCASGWPVAPRNKNDATSCTNPQTAGVCRPKNPKIRCDFNIGCSGSDVCDTDDGQPKYGDYNGNACAAHHVYTAWASATSPPGLPTVANINVFSKVVKTELTVTEHVRWSEIEDPGRFDLQIDGITRAANVGNGGSTGAQPVNPGSHTVSQVGSTGTNASDYITRIWPPCNSSGNITLGFGDRADCPITSTSKLSVLDCETKCAIARDECKKGTGPVPPPKGIIPSICDRGFYTCIGLCAP